MLYQTNSIDTASVHRHFEQVTGRDATDDATDSVCHQTKVRTALVVIRNLMSAAET